MLSSDYYEGCADDILGLYEQLEDDIISDVVRRIMQTGIVTETAKHQLEQLQEAGLLYDEILFEIAKRTDVTENYVKVLFENSGVKSVKFDNEIYHENGLNPVDIRQSPAMLQTLEAGYRKTLGNMKNLTLTTANTSQTAYINACNSAYMQVASGAFSYEEAVRQAVQRTAQQGATVLYPSGKIERIDVALRRAVLTGVGQTCHEISIMNAEECGCDLMEITAHSGARPSHAQWQGQLISLSGDNTSRIIDGRRVLSLKDIGYGTGDGFGGWNCRHDWYPFFEGYSKPNYSAKDLEKLDEKNIEYNGKMYNQYEISQIQRRYEREIRAAKREQIAFRTAVRETDDPELKQVMQDSLNYANSLVKDRQAKMRDFIRQTSQNYPKSNNFEKAVDNSESYGIIKNNNRFVPAEDVKKAEDYARNVLGIKNVSYKGLDTFTANEFNRSLEEHFREFPELKKQINFVGACQERNRLLEIEVRKYYENIYSKNRGKISDDTIEMYIEWDTKMFMKPFALNFNTYAESFSKTTDPNFPDFYGVSVNGDFGKSSEKFIELLKINVKNKYHPVECDTIKSVLDHEMGHQLDKLLGISKMQEVREIFDNITIEETKELLSGYAAKNTNPNKYSEPIAEAWAEYCNNPNPRMIAKFIGDIIVDTYNKKFGKE